MTLQEAMNYEWDNIMGMDASHLKEVVRVLTRATRSRAKSLTSTKNLEALGESPALAQLNRAGGFSLPRDVSINGLRRIYAREIRFLHSKSSTVKGWKEIQNDIGERFGVDYRNWSDEDKTSLWSIIEQLREYNPQYFIQGYSSERAISIIMQNFERDEMINPESALDILNTAFSEYNELSNDEFF